MVPIVWEEHSCTTLSTLAKGVPTSSNANPKPIFALAHVGCTCGVSRLVRECEGVGGWKVGRESSVFLTST